MNLNVSTDDSKSILGILDGALHKYDYVTPFLFSTLLDVAIYSYIRGKGVKVDGVHQHKKRDEVALQIADTLWEFATDDPKYAWFVKWMKRLDKAIVEREIKP